MFLFTSRGFTSVSMDEALANMRQSEGYRLIDVRTPGEFARGHLPGAENLPNETIVSGEPVKALPDLQQTLYVYCRSGSRSKQAARKLAAAGYTNIIECGGVLDYTGPLVTD